MILGTRTLFASFTVMEIWWCSWLLGWNLAASEKVLHQQPRGPRQFGFQGRKGKTVRKDPLLQSGPLTKPATKDPKHQQLPSTGLWSNSSQLLGSDSRLVMLVCPESWRGSPSPEQNSHPAPYAKPKAKATLPQREFQTGVNSDQLHTFAVWQKKKK